MKRKKNELQPLEEPNEEKQPGKIRKFLQKIGKRNVVIACSVLLIGAAVLINWVLFNGQKQKPDGYQGYDQPSGTTAATPADNTVATDTASYFSATQVSRQRARDEALEVLQSVVENTDASEDVKTEALAGISSIADEIRKEADIESLITAKGFEQCVAVLNGDTISIVVKAETLQPAQIAQINEIVYANTGIAPSGVTIINK